MLIIPIHGRLESLPIKSANFAGNVVRNEDQFLYSFFAQSAHCPSLMFFSQMIHIKDFHIEVEAEQNIDRRLIPLL